MKALLAFLLIPSFAIAEGPALTGNARMDLLAASSRDSIVQPRSIMATEGDSELRTKHPLLGGAMSLVLPGAGEFYSGRYVKSGIFFALEVAAITTTLIYNGKGNSKTDEFQTYADLHWSPVRYAKYILAHGVADYGPATANIVFKDGPNPWDQVEFAGINAWESGLHAEGFSHTLPAHGEQQYYELIGKYEQFKTGWDQYPTDAQGVPISDNKDYHGLVPQQMKDYAVERGKANDYFYLAEVATAVVVLNHVLSALDGAWSTANYNREVRSEMGVRLQEVGGGEMAVMTQLTVKVGL